LKAAIIIIAAFEAIVWMASMPPASKKFCKGCSRGEFS